MIHVDQHEGSYLSICKHYRAIYDTPCILEDSSKWQQVNGLSLMAAVYYYLDVRLYIIYTLVFPVFPMIC